VIDQPNLVGTVTVVITVYDCAGNSGSGTVTFKSVTCFCTYTQGGWGADCEGNNPGCIRDQNFGTVYGAAGLVVGAHPFAAGFPYSIWLKTANAVRIYLPAGGTPKKLNKDYTNPTTTNSGSFGGQTTSTHLNVDFDDAGVLASIDPIPLGDLIISSGPFAGMTVRAFLALAESVLSGGPTPAGKTLSQINNTLDAINNNFDGCQSSRGYLERP